MSLGQRTAETCSQGTDAGTGAVCTMPPTTGAKLSIMPAAQRGQIRWHSVYIFVSIRFWRPMLQNNIIARAAALSPGIGCMASATTAAEGQECSEVLLT
jgi:hypothetical protein